eukprot:8047429-Pyramimonas_sp.AAC.1
MASNDAGLICHRWRARAKMQSHRAMICLGSTTHMLFGSLSSRAKRSLGLLEGLEELVGHHLELLEAWGG